MRYSDAEMAQITIDAVVKAQEQQLEDQALFEQYRAFADSLKSESQ